MNVLRDVGSTLVKMFVGDAWLSIAILFIVSLTALLVGYRVAPPLVGGALLFLGSVVVLLASVMLAARRFRDQ